MTAGRCQAGLGSGREGCSRGAPLEERLGHVLEPIGQFLDCGWVDRPRKLDGDATVASSDPEGDLALNLDRLLVAGRRGLLGGRLWRGQSLEDLIGRRWRADGGDFAGEQQYSGLVFLQR